MKSWGTYLRLLVFAPLGCAVASVTTSYEPAPFSHYQPILERMPFGAPPPEIAIPEIDPELLKTAEQEKAEQQQIAKQLSFSALNITPKGTTAVGFTDRSANPPRSFYLEVGASADGWTVLAADYNKDWARFEKDGVTITMHLDKGLIEDPSSTNSVSSIAAASPPSDGAEAQPPSASNAPAEPAATARTARTLPGLVRRPSPTSSRSLSAISSADAAENPQEQTTADSFLERRRERMAQKQAEEKAAKTAAEQASREELNRKVQDELAKREQEQANTVDRLLAEQELFTRQREEAEAREAAEAEQPEPEAEADEQE